MLGRKAEGLTPGGDRAAATVRSLEKAVVKASRGASFQKLGMSASLQNVTGEKPGSETTEQTPPPGPERSS